MADDLSQLLADMRGDAQVLRRNRDERVASILEQWAERLDVASRDLRRFVRESDAMLYSGKSKAWLRAHYADWAALGHAVTEGGVAHLGARTDQPYTYAAYNRQLHDAETRAKVTPRKYRAAHGFRRLVVGNLLAATGNLVAAGAYVGDVDLKVLRRSYVRDRPEELRKLADLAEQRLLGAPTEETK